MSSFVHKTKNETEITNISNATVSITSFNQILVMGFVDGFWVQKDVLLLDCFFLAANGCFQMGFLQIVT